MSAAGWGSLSRHIVRGRHLGRYRTRREFAAHLGISVGTLDNLEGAKRSSYTRDTKTAVEVGLGWAPGSFDRVVAGKRPTRAEDTDLERLLAVWPSLSPDARRILAALAETAVDLVTGSDNPATYPNAKPDDGT